MSLSLCVCLSSLSLSISLTILSSLWRYRPSPDEFPIIVSQDCDHSSTAAVIQHYGDQLKHIKVKKIPDYT